MQDSLAWPMAALGLALALLGALELRRRREMVARACHELRGPLTSLRLSLATMERRREAPLERLAVLELELRRAGLALDDFAAARSGRRAIDRDEPVEVAELLEEQFASWHGVAGAFESYLVLGPVMPGSYVQGDRLRLGQALSNLIANALEHAPGRVDLSARALADRRILIEVADEGAGLPAPVGELIRRPRGGRGKRGRGLAIASDVAERHGGRIVAEPAAHCKPADPTSSGPGDERSASGTRIALELPLLRRTP